MGGVYKLELKYVEHWKKMRTANAIELAFREVRHRTMPMNCFQNSASVTRII
jgi:transposase-like protein